MGLRLKEQKGSRRDPTPGLRGQGTSLGCPAGFLVSNGQGKHPPVLSCSSSLGRPLGPSHLPLLISLASLLCPQGPMQSGGGFGGQGISLGAQQSPWPEWARQSSSAPLLLFPESASHLPLLISLASGCQSCLASTSPLPTVSLHPTGSLWGSSHLLGHQSHPQQLAGTLVVGRH